MTTVSRAQTPIDECANQYVETLTTISPELVTSLGRGSADEGTFSDLSPAGLQKDNDVYRDTLARLSALDPVDEIDRVTKAALTEDLEYQISQYEHGEIGEINVIATPLQGCQEIFDMMGDETLEDWQLIARRLGNIGPALSGWQETLIERREHGPKQARKQVELAISQAEGKASDSSALASLAARGAKKFPQLAEELETNSRQAQAAYGSLAEFLRTEILPSAVESEAFGYERYAPRLYSFTGAHVDLDETYEWGIGELERIIHAQEAIVRDLYGPDVSIPEAMKRLDADPNRQIHGTEALTRWMQETSDQAIRDLNGTHFDIPTELQKLECLIAPSGTGAIYYTGPSDDFSRPGRMWWSVPDGTEVFHTWQEKTTVYHEGVPGHHLQLGMATYIRDSLNDWRRLLCWNSGHGEGWALYAEGLMAELGYHSDPGDYLGVLDGERLRATRVVLDIGVHLEKPAPAGYEHINPTWNRDVAWEFLKDNVAMDHSFLSFELNRYLGWAGQAPAYKIGHRLWKQLRAEAEKKPGFNLKDWHMSALRVGSVGLDILRDTLNRA
ncbi:DUF885 domain-containing protein [Trueperella sp. LYQ143]|uniref:DUF885 domain-containing protein n=1 Tax=unclassified Trueperella TaxID=2630174 RepID=UPI003983478A